MPQNEFYTEEYRINPIPWDPGADKLQIHSVFHSRWKAGYISEKMLACYAIYSITQSGSSHKFSGKHETVHSKGCFSWGRSRLPNQQEVADKKEDLVRKSMLIRQNAFHERLVSHFLPVQQGLIPLEAPERVEKIFDELYDELGKEYPDEARLAGLFFQLLNEVELQQNKKYLDPVLKKAQRFISFHLTDLDLSRPVIARACSVSCRTLSRLFRRELDTTVTDYISQARLNKVSSMLTLPGIPIKLIAAQCGFRSAGFLSAKFKKKYGLSPVEFRKRSL